MNTPLRQCHVTASSKGKEINKRGVEAMKGIEKGNYLKLITGLYVRVK